MVTLQPQPISDYEKERGLRVHYRRSDLGPEPPAPRCCVCDLLLVFTAGHFKLERSKYCNEHRPLSPSKSGKHKGRDITFASILFLLSVIITQPLFAQGGNIGSNSSPTQNRAGVPLPGVNITVCSPLATTAASVTNNLVTFTFATNPITAGFTIGRQIQVTGFTGADTYLNAGTLVNGQLSGGWTILSVSNTTISFQLNHADATTSSNGVVLQQGNAQIGCAALAPVYSDPLLTLPVTQPFKSDQLGNWNVFATPSVYFSQFYAPGVTTTLRQFVVPCVPASPIPGCVGSGTGLPFTPVGSFQENGGSNLFGAFPGVIAVGGNSTYPQTIAGIQAAVTAAELAGGGTVLLGAGTYSGTTGIVINSSFVHIHGSGVNSTVIQYTGTSPLAALVDVGTDTTGATFINADSVNGVTISGNSHVTDALRSRGVYGADFSNNSLINVTGAAYHGQSSVLINLDYLHTTNQEQPGFNFTQQPTNCVLFDSTNGVAGVSVASMNGDICQHVSGDGFEWKVANNVTLTGGTSEDNGGHGLYCYAINAPTACTSNTINATDFESNGSEDILIQGQYNTILNARAGTTGHSDLHFLVSGNQNTVVGGLYDEILVDAFAANNFFVGNIVTGVSGSLNGFIDNSGNSCIFDVSVLTGTGESLLPIKFCVPISVPTLISPKIQATSAGYPQDVMDLITSASVQKWNIQWDSSFNLFLVDSVGASVAEFLQNGNVAFPNNVTVTNLTAGANVGAASITDSGLTPGNCVQAGAAGLLSTTAATCAGQITVNGGSNLPAPVNIQTGPAVNGLTVIQNNPSAGNVQASVTGRATAAAIPTDVVYNDAANTYSTGLQDFSAVTLNVPAAATFTTSAIANLGIAQTAKNLKVWLGADSIIPSANTPGSWVNGDCLQAFVSAGQLAITDAGGVCSTGSTTAWSSITASSNSHAGTFAMSGNTLDLTAAAAALVPLSAAYAPTADASIGVNSSNHHWVFGTNGTTITLPLTQAAVTHQFLTSYTQTTGAFAQAALVSGDIPNNAANTSGTAALATALDHSPTNCSAGAATIGIAASGNSNGCFNPQSITVANASSTGTTVNKLAKLTGAPSTAVIGATTDTLGMVGIVASGAGTTGSAVIQTNGLINCVFDAATTAGDYVIISPSTAGDCHDSGIAGSTLPPSGQVIGYVLSTNGGAGTYGIDETVGGSGSGNCSVFTTLGDTVYGGVSGVCTRLAGPTGPNGIPQTMTDIPASNLAVAETWSIPGVPIDTQTGTSYSIPITDDVHFLTGNNASPTAWTGFALANNYVFSFENLGAGLITYTPASGTVNGNATQIIPKNWFGFHYTNNTNTFMPVLPTIGAFPDCTDSAGNHINFTAATGALSCGTTNSTGCTLSAGVLTCANPIAVGGGSTAVYTTVSANANVEIGSGNGSGGDGGTGTAKVFNPILSGSVATDSNCSNAAAPAVCAAASSGVVAVPTGTNPTLTINTSKVTANSRIFLQIDESATIAATTCNTTLSTLVQPVVTARVASTSFTIQIGAILTTNPACVSFWVIN